MDNDKHIIHCLHVIDSLEIGGAQEFLVNCMKYFNTKAFQVEICALSGKNTYKLKLEDIKTYVLSRSKYNILIILWRLYVLLQSRDYDLVILHLYYSKLFTRIIIKTFFSDKFKIIVHEQNSIDYEFGKYFFYPLIQKLERHLYNNTDMVLCDSKYIQEFYLNTLNYREENCRVFPNGIDVNDLSRCIPSDELPGLKKLRINKDAVVFGFLSRLNSQKGVHYLIEAFRIFIHENKENKRNILVIAGDGPEKERLNSMVVESRMQENVFFIGAVRGSKRSFFEHIDCFLLPSIYEPFGIVLLEALYFRVPIIASRTGGIREVLADGKYGFLFESGNVLDLKNKLSAFIGLRLHNEAMISTMVDVGYEYVIKYYDISNLAKRLENIYSEVNIKHERVKRNPAH